MAETADAQSTSHPNPSYQSSSIHELIDKRQSQELFIGLCGPIGSGVYDIGSQLKIELDQLGYSTFNIRISELITNCVEDANLQSEIVIEKSPPYTRYNSLMDAGSELRRKFGNEICANLAITEISRLRDQEASKGQRSAPLSSTREVALKPRAYIINQLKHPEEIKALNKIYRNNFYLIGVLCDEQRRETGLTTENLSREDAQKLITKDKKENKDHGQQLEKSLFYADFFVNNTNPNISTISSVLKRFINLIHGGSGTTPTQQEVGMYVAYSASLQSACLSRQVGAAIQNKNGDIISTGRNDVPKFSGGLYSEYDSSGGDIKDFRCIHKGKQCYNDLYKLKLKNQIKDIILNKTENEILSEELSDLIYNNTQIKSLIEYSRAIHAEMDALITLTRSGNQITNDCIIYTTTYPCHNCARHIIASGIGKVIYIEPYEKSLALKLHDDAIAHIESNDKVQIVPFQGVAPQRYQIFFSNTKPIKNSQGKVNTHLKEKLIHVDRGYVDSYIEQETKIAENVLMTIQEIIP